MEETETSFEFNQKKALVRSEDVLSSPEWVGLRFMLAHSGFASCRLIGYQPPNVRYGVGWLVMRRVLIRDDSPDGCYIYFRDSIEVWRIIAASINYYQPNLSLLEVEGLRFLRDHGYIVERDEWLGHPASFENYMLRERGYLSWVEDQGIEYVLLTEQGITRANSLPPRERKPLCDSLDPDDDLNLGDEEITTLTLLYEQKKPMSMSVLQDQIDFEILVGLYERGLVGYDYDHNHISLTEVGEIIAQEIDRQNLNNFEKLGLSFMLKRGKISTRQARRQDDRISLGVLLLKSKGVIEYIPQGSGFYGLEPSFRYKGELPEVTTEGRNHTIHWFDHWGKLHDIGFRTSKPTGIPISPKDDRREYRRLYYLKVEKPKREAQKKKEAEKPP